MTERPITFPKTAEGVWTNSETGVKVERYGKGYRAFRPADVTTGYIGICREVRTLAQARSAAKYYVADAARAEIARAYVEAVAEHIERAADAAILAGAPTWRADAARREMQHQNSSAYWLAAAINEVRRLEEWTVEYGHVEAERDTATLREESDARIRAGLAARREPITILNRMASDLVRAGRDVPRYAPYEDLALRRAHLAMIDAAHTAALIEDAERLVAKDGADALVHYWTGYTDVPSACGVDVATTPYTFGSPEWSEVTCKPCEATRPEDVPFGVPGENAPTGDDPLTAYGAALIAERAEDAAELVDQAHAEAHAEDAERMTDAEAGAYYSRLREEPTRIPYIEQARSEALAEHHQRYGVSVGDAVVFVDPHDTGIDTEFVWRVKAVHSVGTIFAYADLVGYAFPEMRSASYFNHLAPAPRCTSREWTIDHEFVSNPDEQGGVAGETICYKVRSHEDHNTDRARAERTIHAARDHVGAATGTPYGGEWPGTTVIVEQQPELIRSAKGKPPICSVCCAEVGNLHEDYCSASGSVRDVAAPSDVHDDAAWSRYAAALPAPAPEAMAEVAVEHSTWTAQRRAAVEAFRSAARTIWSLRAEGLALPGSPAYTSLRFSMQTFRQVINACDRQNEALRRELLTAGSL